MTLTPLIIDRYRMSVRYFFHYLLQVEHSIHSLEQVPVLSA
jgi:hypothetical protein